MGTADIRVAVIDGDDLAPERPFEGQAGALGLGQFGHPLSVLTRGGVL
jgi:hypothetical protein